ASEATGVCRRVWWESSSSGDGAVGHALLRPSIWGLCPPVGGWAGDPPWRSTERTGRKVGSASERCRADTVFTRGRWPCRSAFDYPGVSLQRSDAWAGDSDDSSALSRRERP